VVVMEMRSGFFPEVCSNVQTSNALEPRITASIKHYWSESVNSNAQNPKPRRLKQGNPRNPEANSDASTLFMPTGSFHQSVSNRAPLAP
jgi:hypothetical protein